MEREMIYGTINPTRKSIKILMLNGQRKITKLFTVIKTMQRLITKVNSSINT